MQLVNRISYNAPLSNCYMCMYFNRDYYKPPWPEFNVQKMPEGKQTGMKNG